MASCIHCRYTPSSSENSDEELDPKMLSLPGDKSPEEARLEKKGCIRTLQVFRCNLYKQESRVNQHVDGFVELLCCEEDLRRNCQEEITAQEKYKSSQGYWNTDAPMLKQNLSQLSQSNWAKIRGWWYMRGWILGNSGPLRRGFQLWRSNPSWHMHPVLVEDCKARGGCCSRDCGCCLNPERANTSAGAFGVGHCTLKCGCCSRSRGFELDEEKEEYHVEHFSFDNQVDTMLHKEDPYKQQILLASIWGLSVDDCYDN